MAAWYIFIAKAIRVRSAGEPTVLHISLILLSKGTQRTRATSEITRGQFFCYLNGFLKKETHMLTCNPTETAHTLPP